MSKSEILQKNLESVNLENSSKLEIAKMFFEIGYSNGVINGN